MRKYFLPILLFICFFLVAPVNAQQTTEHISEFNSDITINEDATVDIVEEIHYVFPDSRRGIYWTVPVDYSVVGFKRTTDFKINDVSYYPEGYPSRSKSVYSRTDNSGWVEIRIGEEDVYLTGEYVYVIDYTLKGAGFSFFDDHDEVYLNIIGPGWEVPIIKAQATVHMPVSDMDRVCYTGSDGSTGRDCNMTNTQNGLVITTTKSLGSYEGLTMALGFTVGTIENDQTGRWLGLIIANLGILIPIPVFLLLLSKLKGWKNEKVTIIPHYDVPNSLDPMSNGYVYLNRYDPKHLTASIIWMATKGYLSVEKDKRKTYLIKEVENISQEPSHISDIFNALFKSKDKVDISNLPTSFVTKVTSATGTLSSNIKNGLLYDKKRTNTKGLLTVLGATLAFITPFFLGPILMAFAAIGTALGIFVSAILMLIFGSQIDTRSESGNALYYELLGLKMYINTAEKHRIEFHNDPEKFKGIFEALLPYAIIFGLEKKWVEEFKDLYKNVAPDWYHGRIDTFDLYMINRSISRLNSGVRTATTKTYGSSSGHRSSGWSSGGSGFSGGSSGGGGGGSGGGSW